MTDKYLVLKREDIMHVVRENPRILIHLDMLCHEIERKRINEGKSATNNYIVVNADEPYIEQIVDILKENGHWEGDN